MKALLLFFALLCSGPASAQYHPYGDRTGPPPYPDSFGEKLHYLCNGRTYPYEKEHAMLRSILPEFDKNSDTVFEILELASRDQYLSKLVSSISLSNLDADKKHKAFRNAYQRCVSEGEWRLTLHTLLSMPDVLTKEEIRSHLLSEDEYVRRAAERAIQQITTRERQRPVGEDGDGSRAGRNAPSPDSPGAPVAPLKETSVRVGLAAGLCALIAALGWWHWRRNVKPTKP